MSKIQSVLSWLLLCLLAVTTVIAGPACQSTSTSVQVTGVPSNTNCIILYNSAYKEITQFEGSASGTFSASGLSAETVYVEFYYDSKCSDYDSNVQCTIAPPPSTPPPTTPPPTTPPPSGSPTTPPSTPPPTTPPPTTPPPSAPSCSSTSSTVQINGIPSKTECLILYDSSYKFIESVSPVSGSSLSVSSLKTETLHVEFYTDPNCNDFLSEVDCVAGTAPPTSGPTGSPTSGPTGSPTSGPTGSPTSGPTGSPTSGPTGSPTSGPTGSPTSEPTGSPTSGPTGSPTQPPGAACVSTSTSTSLSSIPSQTNCLVLYDSSYKYIKTVTPITSSSVTVTGLSAEPIHVEFYSDLNCSPSDYLTDIICSVASTG